MIEDKFKVDGKDFKKLPLKVAGYVRSLGLDHDDMLDMRVDIIKDFVEEETEWDLDYWYTDNNCSAICSCHQPELSEMLYDILFFDDPTSHSFDIIVVTSFSQIARNQTIINYMVKEGKELKVPVFCMDTQTIITSYPDEIAKILSDCACARSAYAKELKYYDEE